MFKNILVAFDGSDLAEKALTMGEEMAAQNGATLHIFHVNIVSASLSAQAASSPALADMLSTAGEKVRTKAQELMKDSTGISPLISVAEAPETVAYLQQSIPGGNVFNENSIHEIMTSAVVTPYFPKYEQALTMADTAVSEMISSGSLSEDDLLAVQREINQFLKK